MLQYKYRRKQQPKTNIKGEIKMKKIKNTKTRAQLKAARMLAKLHNDERGIDIIVIIVVLAILIAIAALFNEQMTAFVKSLFEKIMIF